MKKVLELLEEFGQLNDAKIESGGSLSPTEELRWGDLKEFYDRLMSISPPKKGLDRRRFLAFDLRKQVKHRGRLRVRTEMDVFFRFQKSYLPSQLVNVSCGGLFMGSEVLLSKGSRVRIYMPNLGSDYGELFETEGEVAWSSAGASKSDLPRGMGIRFCRMKGRAAEQLDAVVVDSLEERISLAADIPMPSFKKYKGVNSA